MASATDLIRKIDFFESLNQRIIDQIARLCAELDYATGDQIVRQGDTGLGLFFILQGTVKVEVENNGVRTTVASMRPGDFFGELSLIDNKPRSAHVTCMEDTQCLVLTRDTFIKLSNKYPEIALQIAAALAGRLRAANEKLGNPSAVTETPPTPGAPKEPSITAASQPQAATSTTTSSSTSLIPGKDQMKDFLVNTFGFIYMVKAMTRFSAALIGCPVNVEPEPPRSQSAQAVIEGVKVVLFPATAHRVLRIVPFDDGVYSATVIRPGTPLARRALYTLEGRVCRDQTLYLHIPAAAEPWIEEAGRHSRVIAPNPFRIPS